MKILKTIFIITLILGMTSFVLEAAEQREAKIAAIDGKASVKLMGQTTWIPADVGMKLKEGDVIKTNRNSWALLELNGSGQTASVEVEENSKLMIAELTKDSTKGTQQTLLDLAIGEIMIKAKKLHSAESRFEVKTPTSIVGVRGTTFSVKVEAMEE